MINIQFHLVALLTLAATVARSVSVDLLNEIPLNTIMDEGTTFVLRWAWDGDATGVGKLDLLSLKSGDLDSSMYIRLEDKLNLTAGRYPWVVKAPEGRDTLDWSCSLGITYDDGAQYTSGRSFKIRAAPKPSTTSADAKNVTTSTTMTTLPSSRTSGISTQIGTPQQPPLESKSSNTLPAGTIAGIVVGSILGAGAFATLAALVVYYRRKANHEKKGLAAGSSPSSSSEEAGAGTNRGTLEAQYRKPELDAGAEKVYYELDGTAQIQEVDAPSRPTELDSNARSELDGDGRRLEGLR